MTIQTVTIDTSAAALLVIEAEKTLESAKDFLIDSPTMFELASEDLKRIKALQKQGEEKRTTITGPLNAALRATNDLFRSPKDYLEKAEATLKRSILTYTAEQEKIAAKARAEAEAVARAERERLAAIEQEKYEAAKKAQAEAQAAALKGDSEAAEKAMAAAQQAEAEALALQMTQQVVTVAPAVEAQKVSGISGRVTYSAEVYDLKALIAAVAEGKAPIESLQADTKFLGAQARAFKKAGELYPGVASIASRGLAARAA